MVIDFNEFNERYHQYKDSIYSLSSTIDVYKSGIKSVNTEIIGIDLKDEKNKKVNEERLKYLNSYVDKMSHEISWRQSKLSFIKEELKDFLSKYKASALVEIGEISVKLNQTECPDVRFQLVNRRSCLKEITLIANNYENEENHEEREQY